MRACDMSQTLFMLTECAAETLEDSQESQRCRSLLPTNSTPLPPPWAAASQTMTALHGFICTGNKPILGGHRCLILPRDKACHPPRLRGDFIRDHR